MALDVGIANYEIPPQCGGGGQITQTLMDTLEDRGHTARLETLESELRGGRSTRMEQLLYPLKSYSGLRKMTDEVDVLNCHFSVPCGPSSALVSWLDDVPLVTTVMGADLYDPTRFNSVRPILNVVNKQVFSHSDHVVVPSTDMADRLPEMETPVSVIPHAVDLMQYHPDHGESMDPRRTNLITVARLVERKSLETVIKALEYLPITVSLTIVGKGPERDHLEAVARDCNVSERVEFRGYVVEEDLPETLASHDIFVLPSEHEAFGVAVVEALASGLPAIVTACGGPEDIVTEDCGQVVPKSEPGQFAKAVSETVRQCESMSDAARTRAVDFSRQSICKQYEELFWTYA